MESHGLVNTYFCNKCKTTKPLSEFYRDKRSAKGHYSYCKPCKNAMNRNDYVPSTREDTRPFFGRVLNAKQLKVRPCLKCDKPTETDFSNRLCPQCAYYHYTEGYEEDVAHEFPRLSRRHAE